MRYLLDEGTRDTMIIYPADMNARREHMDTPAEIDQLTELLGAVPPYELTAAPATGGMLAFAVRGKGRPSLHETARPVNTRARQLVKRQVVGDAALLTEQEYRTLFSVEIEEEEPEPRRSRAEVLPAVYTRQPPALDEWLCRRCGRPTHPGNDLCPPCDYRRARRAAMYTLLVVVFLLGMMLGLRAAQPVQTTTATPTATR